MTKQNYRHASALLFLATLAGPASLLAQYSSPIHDVENPAHSVVRLTGQLSINPGSAFAISDLTNPVPLGKRLAIEYASLRCTAFSSTGVDVSEVGVRVNEATSVNTVRFHLYELAFTKTPGGPVAVGYYTSQPLRVYSDGTTIPLQFFVSLTDLVPANGVVNCAIELSGYTVNLP